MGYILQSAFFPNLQISAILITFLSRMDGLLLKHDMMILYSGNLSGFRFLPDFPDFFKSSNFNNFDLELRQYKNRFVSVKRMLVLKLRSFSLAVQVKEKGSNFKTNMFFTEASLFLYCLSSSFFRDLMIYISNMICRYSSCQKIYLVSGSYSGFSSNFPFSTWFFNFFLEMCII